MNDSVPPPRKAGLPLRIMHWLMVLAIVSAWTFIYAKGLFDQGAPERAFLTSAHIFAGLGVLLLLLPRVAARLLSPLPAVTPSPPRWQSRLARLVHALLYVGMLLTPVLGILFVQTAGKDISFLGLTLPDFIGTHKSVSHGIREVHETLGLAMLYLVIAHAGAALYHHLFQRDDALKRML
ncbi:MAG: cytochrome b [Betaproteobacteria bacterium]|nr:cytochrome b [Betaproteobacteria bacterium]